MSRGTEQCLRGTSAHGWQWDCRCLRAVAQICGSAARQHRGRWVLSVSSQEERKNLTWRKYYLPTPVLRPAVEPFNTPRG